MSRRNKAVTKQHRNVGHVQLLEQASKLHSNGKIDQAEALYNKILVTEPNNPSALYLLGVVNIQKQNYNAALSLLEQSLEINPTNISAHYNHGLVLQTLYRCDKAAISYLAALQINPKHLPSLTNLGSVYMYLENYSAAEEVYRKLVVQTNQNANALNNLGMCLFRRGELDKAIKYYEQAYEKDANFSEVNNNLGFAYQTKGNFEKALAHYKQAVEINPIYGTALNNLGSLYFQLQKLEESKDAYLRASKCKDVASVSHIALAIDAWLSWDLPAMEGHLAKARSYEKLSYSENQLKFIEGYEGYLYALAKFAKENGHLYNGDQDLPLLKVVGDSHCLSFHNLIVRVNDEPHRLQTRLIVGCKAWSLANQTHNQYKQALAAILERVKSTDKLIFTFGEIDCRLDEGILPFCAKHSLSSSEEASKLGSAYKSSLLEKTNSEKQQCMILNVPKSQACVDSESPELEEVILAFNESLIDESKDDDRVIVLDSYSLSRPQDNHSCFLDGVHLRPDSVIRLF